MSIVGIGSVRGAPGVTTAALLLAAGIEGSVLVEADPNGGTIAVRYSIGREPGLTTLAAVNPADPGGWRAHAQVAGRVPVLVGPDAADRSEALWRSAGGRLTSILQCCDASAVVVDAGRLATGSAIVSASDLLVVLVQPVAEHLVALSNRLAGLRDAVRSHRVVVVLAGDGPYRRSDIEAPLGVEVVGVLPDDRHASDLLAGGARPGKFARTRLARAAAGLSATVERALDVRYDARQRVAP